ncbi:MAG TPA: glucuronate isomerase [Bacteroidales bacterium]|nr:glucuronate isomerase [Bacteroidales bacterium]
MKPLIHPGFLFTSQRGEKLYHDYAERLPIVDFHCHLSPAMIESDRQFENLTRAWLEGDHYKWRVMRMNGVPENFCTGNASDQEKYLKWAETVPYTVGNPVYHWTHLELARYFNLYDLLSPSTAASIYNKALAMLKTREFSARSLIRKMNVEIICTTDDPADDLKNHISVKSGWDVKVLPTFRADNVLKTEDPDAFKRYMHRLSEASEVEIKNTESLFKALERRHKFFHENGCRLSDNGLNDLLYSPVSQPEADKSLKKLMKGEMLDAAETNGFRTLVLSELCRMNNSRGWTQQFHLGAKRNNSFRMFMEMGPDTGWDSIGKSLNPYSIAAFFSNLEKDRQLARTILYNSNPSDNAMMITMAGNFCDGTIQAKVSNGAPWWFLDQKDGIERHLLDISSFGLLSRFAGMVTDSRSILSYPRHEYFRRIACNFIGKQVDTGLMPDDEPILRMVIENICYRNAKNYLGFR